MDGCLLFIGFHFLCTSYFINLPKVYFLQIFIFTSLLIFGSDPFVASPQADCQSQTCFIDFPLQLDHYFHHYSRYFLVFHHLLLDFLLSLSLDLHCFYLLHLLSSHHLLHFDWPHNYECYPKVSLIVLLHLLGGSLLFYYLFPYFPLSHSSIEAHSQGLMTLPYGMIDHLYSFTCLGINYNKKKGSINLYLLPNSSIPAANNYLKTSSNLSIKYCKKPLKSGNALME